MPATLYRLAKERPEVYESIAFRLNGLVRDIRKVGVDRDDKHDVLTLWATVADGTRHTARSLSDGTLRFLALAVLEADPSFHGVLCLEEPENGIHPERISAMIRLLQDIAVMSALGIRHIERNGHHYFRGTGVWPAETTASLLREHGDLYVPRGEIAVLRIENGALDAATVVNAPLGLTGG